MLMHIKEVTYTIKVKVMDNLKKAPHIAVLLTVHGTSQAAILKGFQKYLALKNLNTAVTVSIHAAESYDERIAQQLTYNIHHSQEYDLFYTIGVIPTQAAATVTSMLDQHLIRPIIFCATAEGYKNLQYKGIPFADAPHVTGVEFDKTSAFIPLSLLPHIKKNMHTVLVPYLNNKLMEYEALQAQAYFKDQDIKIDLLPIDNGTTYAQQIISSCKGYDSIILPYDSWISFPEEYTQLSTFCEQSSITLFTNTPQTHTENITFGHQHDFEKLGATCAQLATEVLLEAKSVADIPVYYLDEPQILTLNKTALESQGVILNSHIITHIEDNKLPTDHFFKPIGTLIPDYATLYSNIITALCDEVKKCKHMAYNPTFYDAPIEFPHKIIDIVADMMTGFHMLIIGGKECIEETSRQLQQQLQPTPTIGIVSQEHDIELFSSIQNNTWPYENIIPLGIASPSDLTQALEISRHLHPTGTLIKSIWQSRSIPHLKQLQQKRFNTNLCAFNVFHTVAEEVTQVNTFLEELNPDPNHIFYFDEHTLDEYCRKSVLYFGQKYNTMIIANDIEGIRNGATAGYVTQTDKVAKVLIHYLDTVLYRKLPLSFCKPVILQNIHSIKINPETAKPYLKNLSTLLQEAFEKYCDIDPE